MSVYLYTCYSAIWKLIWMPFGTVYFCPWKVSKTFFESLAASTILKLLKLKKYLHYLHYLHLQVSYMAIYLTCTLALSTLSVILTVLVLHFHHKDAQRDKPVGHKMRRFIHIIQVGSWPLAILLKKMTNFVHFFLNIKFFAIFWHSNGNFPEGQV